MTVRSILYSTDTTHVSRETIQVSNQRTDKFWGAADKRVLVEKILWILKQCRALEGVHRKSAHNLQPNWYNNQHEQINKQ